MKVTNEPIYEGKAVPGLVDDIIKSDSITAVGKLFADYSNDIFRYLTYNDIYFLMYYIRNKCYS